MSSASEYTTTSPPPPEKTEIVFLEPSEPFLFQPLIEDLLRTRFCISGSVFLVEAIDPLIPVKKEYRAVRLLVSDGILCVQALLKSEAHGLVENGRIYAGCFVRVASFKLRFFEVQDEAKGSVKGQNDDGSVVPGKKRGRESKSRKMAYLILENPITVGWNTAYMKILQPDERRPPAELSTSMKGALPNPKRERRRNITDEDESLATAAPDGNMLDVPHSKTQANEDYGGIAEPEADATAADLEPMNTSVLREAENNQDITKVPNPTTKPLPTSSEPLPWSSEDPTKPLKLTPLRQIPNLPYKQNWMVNVLAVIASISDVEPSHLPPYHQRTARLADPSTSKQVLLTVFLDSDDFSPGVGSVVLILGVKNHRFDGGSLKKYASDRPKRGSRWWFENPTDLGWCDVAGLRDWWDGKQTAG
jgi:hypothetical protein